MLIQYKSRLSAYAKRIWFLANAFEPVGFLQTALVTRASASAPVQNRKDNKYILQSDQFSMGLASNWDRQNKTVLAIVIGVLVSKIIVFFCLGYIWNPYPSATLSLIIYLRDTSQLAVIAWVARSYTLVVSVGIPLSSHYFCLHWIAFLLVVSCFFVCCFPVLFSKIRF